MAQRRASYSPDMTGTVVETEITARFRKALAARGVPAAGADALLRRIRETARLSRTGRLTDEQASAKVALLLIATETKAADLARARRAAGEVFAGRVSLVDARARIRGAA